MKTLVLFLLLASTAYASSIKSELISFMYTPNELPIEISLNTGRAQLVIYCSLY
ncbi:MAG: hypothetical protein ABL927_04695 [Bdellovibrionales bacterium]